jgi:N-formylglutamate amidohydrolase
MDKAALDPQSIAVSGQPDSGGGLDETAYSIDPPTADAPSTPLVFASPHSGSIYPPAMIEALRLSTDQLRNSEDSLVDALIASAPALGATVIRARYARAFVDLNRAPFELDPSMFEDELPDFARARTARVAAGLGTIARVAGGGREIYRRKLTFAEAKGRIDTVHRPYHDALTRLLAQARAGHGLAVLVDWHSMPSEAAHGPTRNGRKGPQSDIVLGDRFGAACAPALSAMAEQAFTQMGYRCARNAPYAGGFTTEHYGRPGRRTHALQIEINRALYLDETSRLRTAGFAQLSRDIAAFTARIAAFDWARLR